MSDYARAYLSLADSKPWWDDPRRIAALGRWLAEQGREPADSWYFIEKCRTKWCAEYEDMVADEREAELERLAEEERAYEREGRWAP